MSNPCVMPLDVTSKQLNEKVISLKLSGKVYHFMDMSLDKLVRTGRGYMMRVMGCPLNWLVNQTYFRLVLYSFKLIII